MKLPGVVDMLRRTNGVMRRARLIYADFKGDPYYMWMGFGSFRTGDGRIWQGVGDAVKIDGGPQQEGIVAGNLQITLAATPQMIAKAQASQSLVYGRRLFVANQFCDDDWQPVDQYFATFAGVMDTMNYNMNHTTASIVLNVEDAFARNGKPRIDYFSDRSRKSKYPNDRLFENISDLKNKKLSF